LRRPSIDPKRVRRMIAAVLTFVAAAATSLALPASQAGASLGGWPGIAFVRPVQGMTQLFSVKVYGGEVTQITSETNPVHDATWSPDGSTIAFIEEEPYGSVIFLANADGSSVTEGPPLYLSHLKDLAWSPDGITFAVASDYQGGWHIWSMQIDGTRKTQLTAGAAVDAGPSWSPDGSLIAFTRTSRRSHLFTMAEDGTALTQVTRGHALDADPTWSPLGTAIAFSSNRGGGHHLFTVAPGGSDLTQMTQGAGIDTAPTWSPWGEQIAFTRRASGSRSSQVIVRTVRSGHEVAITDGSASDASSAWQEPSTYNVSLDDAAKKDELKALAVARQYRDTYGTYEGLDYIVMSELDPSGIYVSHNTPSTGSDISVSDGHSDTFIAARLSETGMCFGLEDVAGVVTTYGVESNVACSADGVQAEMILGPTWPRA
jgi:dipeptidyl aminopeptidase/acylaminoacyl peptidase